MTLLNFPPTNGQPTDGSFTYTANGVVYTWDGEKWTANSEQGLDGNYVNKDGDTMTGDLTVPNLISQGDITAGGDITADGNISGANGIFEGDVQTTSLNGGPLAGFRNALIGNFYVWQRNVSATIPSTGESYLTADRWLMRGTSLTGGAVISSRAYVEGNKYQALRFTVTSPTTSHLSTYQKVEAVNCRHLAGKEITFSVYATNFTPVLTVGYRDSSDAIQFVAGTTVSLGGDRFSTTVTLPDVQFGSDFDETGLEVFIQTPLNTAVANGQYNIWHPQFEPGPVATPFELRPIGTELALCQRYYFTAGNVYAVAGERNGVRATFPYTFKETMRAVPTVTNTGGKPAEVSDITINGCAIRIGASQDYISTNIFADAEL